MALSGSVKTSSYSGRYYQLDWTATQSIESNTSTISWTLRAAGKDGYWYAERTLNATINGASVFSKTDYAERWVGAVASGTKTVTHDSSGAATISIAVKAAVYGSTVNCTGSDTFTLNTIPRKSTLTVANGTLGSLQKITVTRKSTNFVHTITYRCGSASGTIVEKANSTSISFTPPLSLATQNTSGTSVSITYTITTYNGSTSIGSDSCTRTCDIPSGVAPSCTLTLEDVTGIEGIYGLPVQGLSRIKITANATPAYGSPVVSYLINADGAKYTHSPATTDSLKSYGTLTISAKVTDARGRTRNVSNNLSVLQYTLPKVSRLSVYRCDAAGADNDQGEYVRVEFDASVTPLRSINTARYTLRYKKTADTGYTEIKLTSYSNIYNVSGGKYVFPADGLYSYDVEIVAADSHHSTALWTSVSTAYTIFDVGASGRAWAFGKVSERDGLEVAMDAEFTGHVDIFARPSGQDGPVLARLYRADRSLAALLTLADSGDGVKLYLYKAGKQAGVIELTADGAVASRNTSYGTATT